MKRTFGKPNTTQCGRMCAGVPAVTSDIDTVPSSMSSGKYALYRVPSSLLYPPSERSETGEYTVFTFVCLSARTQSINRLCTGRWSPWRHRCTACCGKSILRDMTFTFLYISPKTLLRSWTWLYLQTANKTTFPTISCPCGNIVNFSHTSWKWIHFSANNTSFRPFKWMGAHSVQSSTACVPPTTHQPLLIHVQPYILYSVLHVRRF